MASCHFTAGRKQAATSASHEVGCSFRERTCKGNKLMVDVIQHRSEDFGPNRNRLVKSLHDMAKVLILAWPSDDGEEYVIAVKRVLTL